jgi:hypothetical protein
LLEVTNFPAAMLLKRGVPSRPLAGVPLVKEVSLQGKNRDYPLGADEQCAGIRIEVPLVADRPFQLDDDLALDRGALLRQVAIEALAGREDRDAVTPGVGDLPVSPTDGARRLEAHTPFAHRTPRDCADLETGTAFIQSGPASFALIARAVFARAPGVGELARRIEELVRIRIG